MRTLGRHVLVFTGIVGLIGGLATLGAGASCDLDCVDSVCPDSDGDDPRAATPDERDGEPIACDMMARPSAMVYVGILHDDYIARVAVDHVWYEHEGRVAEATCASPDPDGDACMMWIAGWELAGKLTVATEYCDTVVEETVEIELDDAGCHVETRMVWLRASTLGCLTSEPPPAESPAAAVDELRIPPPTGDPFGPRLQVG